MDSMRFKRFAAWVLSLAWSVAACAEHDIEFVSEHLPEIAMDNRYATLPLWTACAEPGQLCGGATAGYATTRAGTLSLDGPMFAASLTWPRDHWTFSGFAFYDPLSFSSGIEHRPLNVIFTNDAPLSMPVAAEFTGLNGEARDYGVGFAARREATLPLLGKVNLSAGLLWQVMSLHDFRYDYRVLEGPDAGLTGTLDYDNDYQHWVPFAGIAWERGNERWRYQPHVQFAMPLPRRGMVGHITGPGFDLRGDQDSAGHGKHFGDPSLTIGFDVTYLPWNLSVDIGTALTQYLLEPQIHDGVSQDLVLMFRWDGRPH